MLNEAMGIYYDGVNAHLIFSSTKKISFLLCFNNCTSFSIKIVDCLCGLLPSCLPR